MTSRSTHRLAVAWMCLVISVLAACQPKRANIAAAQSAGLAHVVVDAFDDDAAWTSHPADGVELVIGSDTGEHGRAMRLDVNFARGGGYAVARRELQLDLPDNYAFTMRLRGEIPPNHLEFKLIDASGENVWWSVRRHMVFQDDWATVKFKRRHIQFAWGPLGGGEIRRVAAIEIAITAGSGGTGSVWIDDLVLTQLPPPNATPPPPLASATSEVREHPAHATLDADTSTSWRSDADDTAAALMLDFQFEREFGGLIIDWEADAQASHYVIEASSGDNDWQALRTVKSSNGGRDYLYLPESESRFLRLRTLAPPVSHVGVRELFVQDLEWSATRESFFEAVSRDAPTGTYPRAFSKQQTYWTVVGVDADKREVLFGEDGRLEIGKAAPSIEPFLLSDGKLTTWADVNISQSLAAGHLPIPSVRWELDKLALDITACAVGEAGASGVLARYGVHNTSDGRVDATLYLAVRPFQVNPPTQSLNTPGGTAPIHALEFSGQTLHVNRFPVPHSPPASQAARVVSLTQPATFGATAFDQGSVVDYLRDGTLPSQASAEDEFGAASGAFAYELRLDAGETRAVELFVPLYETSPQPPIANEVDAHTWAQKQFDRARAAWENKTSGLEIVMPAAASDVLLTLRSQLAYVLVNRAGPAIQPGSRAYARSWIRDGALTSSALLRLGHPEPVRQFIEWFAPHQYDNGKVPCCVDERGADPVPEHDSSGEFIFLIAEYLRYTHDREFVKQLWPRVTAAVAYLDALRNERRSDEFRTANNGVFFGLLPPSISHEGYSAKPMHSYWDDFFALRGFKDAAWLARELGEHQAHSRFTAIRDEFQGELVASLEAAMHLHSIDYLPGCADLGDFDATSTTIALAPVGAGVILPQAALHRTFEKYYEFFVQRREANDWRAYTPYELRNVGAFVRLGWRDRAHELLDFFLAHRRPRGWRHWGEVVFREPRSPNFIGDMPHTWVGSDFIRSILDMLAYTDEDSQTLVIGAGVPMSWLQEPGISVRNLPTPYGLLTFAMQSTENGIEIELDAGVEVPPGGVELRLPPTHWHEMVVNGTAVPLQGQRPPVVHTLPAKVILKP